MNPEKSSHTGRWSDQQIPAIPPQALHGHQSGVLDTPRAGRDALSADLQRERSRKNGVAKTIDYLRWTLVALELILLLQFGLMLLGADPSNLFTAYLYSLAGFFLVPFEGHAPLVPDAAFGPGGSHRFEWTVLIAMGVYWLLFYHTQQFLRITISKPREPGRSIARREVLAMRENPGSGGTPRSGHVLEVLHRVRAGTFRSESPLSYVEYEAGQVEERQTPEDGIVHSPLVEGLQESPLVNQQIAGYTLMRQIGHGGYASVYLALCQDLQTPVALKLLHPLQTDNGELERFQFEARLLARLRHPHIVRALDFGWHGPIPFLAMEYAPGGNLAHAFPPGLALAARALLPTVSQAASALQYLHHLGLVHCDVKPDNLLLGPSNTTWLCDFGITQCISSTGRARVDQHDLVGTPRYVAPEQINGDPLPASDQYALAAVVYQWLCGRPPFLGTPIQLCLQHLEAPPPPPRCLVPSIPLAVERVVLRALDKNPRRRFPHILQFAQALRMAIQESYLDGSVDS